MFPGLPGGSPGPHATGTLKGLLFMLVLGLTAGALFCWLFIRAAEIAG
jgi:hypothetical protein